MVCLHVALKAAGLVVLVDRKSLPHGEVLTADPKPGRVQHIRLATSSWTLDLLHVYQKPYNFHPKASQDAKAVRAAVWQELETQIRRVPKRHTLLILGDNQHVPQIGDVQAVVDVFAGAVDRDGQRQQSHGSRQKPGLARPGPALAGPTLELTPAASRGPQESQAYLHFRSDRPNHPSSEGCDRGLAASLQVASQAQPGCEGRLDTVSACDQPPRGSSSPVGNTEIVDRPVLMAHSRVSATEGAASIRLPHSGALELLKGVPPSLKSLLQVALHNTSQLFYLNSTAYAIAWTTLQAKLHGAGSMDLVPALRILCKLRSSALPLKLLAQFPWATLLQGWPHIHQQHDAPELVTHLMPRLGITHVAGRWEARWRVNQQVQVFDHGTLLAPIKVIQQWHSQARLHALAIAPVFLCVQLNRFTGDDGELSRDTRPLQGIDCTIRIPVFTATDTLQIRQVPFQVTSAQLHFGERPTSGHYRAVLNMDYG